MVLNDRITQLVGKNVGKAKLKNKKKKPIWKRCFDTESINHQFSCLAIPDLRNSEMRYIKLI